jgi:polyhydroxyalkanoate synthase subunit PhaC
VVNADTTFILTTGGHNASMVSPPGADGREFRISAKAWRAPDADQPYERATHHGGSWCPVWAEYIASHSSGPRISARPAGAVERGYPPLNEAQGTYVREA